MLPTHLQKSLDRRDQIARHLALTSLDGVWTPRALSRRIGMLFGAANSEYRIGLLRDIFAGVTTAYPPPPDELTQLIRESVWFERIVEIRGNWLQTLPIILHPSRFAPAAAIRHLDLPGLATPADLAAWLGISIEQLLSFTRHWRDDRVDPALRHYTYAFATKRGGGPPRLIEAPKSRLKKLQRRILHEILDRVPVDPHAHGFVSGRSSISASQLHAGEAVVLSLDLHNFFLESRLSRVHATFRTLGYPPQVARLLTALCSTQTPRDVFETLSAAQRHDWQTRKRFANSHLSQGAPTSPALANLGATALDRRLAGLADAADAVYSRYADDLFFSGNADFARRQKGFVKAVAEIVSHEGFRINAAKTRIMPRHARQRILGLVVNDHCNIARDEFDILKATLHNCRRDGPENQNRHALPDFRSHLDGRIGWVEQINPARGAKLRQVFDEVRWGDPL
jgi:hypothetical protein